MNSFPHYGVSGLIMFVACFIFGSFVLFKNPKKAVNRAFWLFSISVGVYGLGFFGVDFFAHDKQSSLLWWQIMQAGVMFIAPANVHALFLFMGEKKKWAKYLYSIPLVFLFIITFLPHLLYKDMVLKFSRTWYAIATPLYFIFWIIWVFEMIYMFYFLLRSYKTAPATTQRQVKYLLTGLFIGYATGCPSFLPMYNINFFNVLNYGVVFYPLLTGYSVIRYRLFEIDTVIHRTILWLITLVMLVLPVSVLVLILKDWLMTLPPVGMLLLSSLVLMFFVGYFNKLKPQDRSSLSA